VAFPVHVSNIGHYYEPGYVAELLYDASGVYRLLPLALCTLHCIDSLTSTSAVPTIDKQDISFHGNALEHGVGVEFHAGTIKFSTQIPQSYSLHVEALLEWLD